jgi:predicted Zn-dependent peptidase
MKKLFFSICAISLFSTLNAQTLDRSIIPQPGPAPEIHLGQAESFTLDNGLKVFVVENHKLPLVTYSIQLDIRPALQGDKTGMQSFVGELITDGTKTRSKEAFDKEMDEIGAHIGASSEGMYGQALTKHQDKLLDLMSDALINANFQQTLLDKLKKQTKSALEANRNDPDAMLDNVTSVLTYGRNHPYGEVPTESTIENVTLADCNNYYHTYFHPNVAYMAVVGDITLAEAKKLVSQYFGAWQKADVPRTAYPQVIPPAKTTVDFVPRDGAVQSVIGITYPIDLKPGTPDVIKANAMNEILGGSSQGRLFQNLRETHGWTYGAYSRVSSDEIAGKTELYAKCRNVVTDSSVQQMLVEMNRLRDSSVAPDVVKNTLNFMSGKFALALESPQTIASFAINIARYNMPADYYKNYLKNVNAVSPGDIKAMAEKYLRPEHAHIVVVGNQSEADKLKKFSADGKLNYYDNLGNSQKAPEIKIIDGVGIKDVLQKYIDAIGGKTAIEGMQNLTINGVGERTIQGNKNEFNVKQIIASPDKFKQSITIEVPKQMGSSQTMERREVSRIVVNGDKGYIEQGGGKQDMPQAYLLKYKEEADIQTILHPEKYGISYELLGKKTLDGEEVYSVQKVSNNGKDRAAQFYSVQTGLLVQEITKDEQGISYKKFSDYKEVKNGNGYKIPYTIDITGAAPSTFTVKYAKANGKVKDSAFK